MALAILLPMGEPSKGQGGEGTGVVKIADRVLRRALVATLQSFSRSLSCRTST
ncbi:hypothetical protein X769_24920 [Mesorhizobium sp. LSJC268A00]|nr:hypothetical protein X769_24920 [Mesorhizobium sp. LSJC268A00]